MQRNIFLAFLSLLPFAAFAQFQDVSNQYNISNESDHSVNGSGLSYYDYDKDGWDDLTIATKGIPIKVYHNSSVNGFELAFTFPSAFDAKHPIWVDYDNDGDADFFIGLNLNSCRLYRNDGENVFTDVTADLNLPLESAETHGCAWADYDSDGWLDCYISNYNRADGVTNWLLHSNGDGTFTEVADSLGVDNGSKATFQSSWIDYDLDGDVDLFVVNDHQEGNFLYANNGDGTFYDASEESGALLYVFSMCSTMCDYDNDCDLDMYVSNVEYSNILMNNENGFFQNVAEQAGVAGTQLSWGAIWLDYDNNFLEDLFVTNTCPVDTGCVNPLYANQGNGTFMQIDLTETGNDYHNAFCVAKGDLDNDGYADFATTNSFPTSVSIWQNVMEGNNWLKITLQGTISNRDAIGTLLKLHSNGQTKLIQTKCGDNYLSQDSQHITVGMNDILMMDSMIVTWPSGWIDRYYEIAGMQSIVLVEGETFANAPVQDVNITSCSNEVVTLDPGLWSAYLWNNGDTLQTIEVTESGTHTVIVTNEFGLQQMHEYDVVITPMPEIAVFNTAPVCNGESTGYIFLDVQEMEVDQIIWNNNEEITGDVLDSIGAGNYSYHITDIYGCQLQGSIELTEPNELTVEYSTPVVCFGAATNVSAAVYGGTGPYVLNWNGVNPQNLSAGDYLLTVTDANQCEATELIQVIQVAPIVVNCSTPLACFNSPVGIDYLITGGFGDYILDWIGANPDSLYAGDYVLNVVDENNCTASENFSVYEATEIVLVPEITNAYDGANGNVVVNVSGGYTPYTYLWSGGGNTNTLTDAAQGTYTCVVTDALNCTQSIEVEVIDLAVNEFSQPVLYYPNPLGNALNVTLDKPQPVTISDVMGCVVYHSNANGNVFMIDTAQWSAGIYFLHTTNYSARVIKH